VDVIEHGFGINDETRARLASTGTPLSRPSPGSCGAASRMPLPEREPTLTIADRHLMRMNMTSGRTRCRRFGPIGSDPIGWPSQPQMAVLEEFALAVEWGLSPADALTAGTVRGAAVLGLAGVIGELRAGFAADIVACVGDPTSDISALQSIDSS
jgi:imidazolonepropionase-like amidohydrolase